MTYLYAFNKSLAKFRLSTWEALRTHQEQSAWLAQVSLSRRRETGRMRTMSSSSSPTASLRVMNNSQYQRLRRVANRYTQLWNLYSYSSHHIRRSLIYVRWHVVIFPGILQGIKMYSVGITDNVKEEELRAMSSPPQQINNNYWMAPDFTMLDEVLSSIVSTQCGKWMVIWSTDMDLKKFYCWLSWK